MTTLADIQDVQTQLIRKTLNMEVAVADYSAATIDETTLFDPTSGALAALPAGYSDLGSTTVDGAQFSRSISTSTVPILQSLSPGRLDTTGDTTTMQVVCDEIKLITLSLLTGAAQSGITAGVNGVVRVDQPKTPTTRDLRVLAISEDTTTNGPIYICRYMPKANITAHGNLSFARTDNPIQTDVTFTGLYDSADATDHSWIFGGEGWLALLSDMGLSNAS